MDRDEIIALVSSWPGVVALTPGPGSAAPEIAWGDTFFSYAPDGAEPAGGQPFATLVTKDYPDDEGSRLDRPGVFRVSIAAGRGATSAWSDDGGRDDEDKPDQDPGELDRLRVHPVYGSLGWVAVLNPGPRTAGTTRALLRAAYEAARRRHERRHPAP